MATDDRDPHPFGATPGSHARPASVALDPTGPERQTASAEFVRSLYQATPRVWATQLLIVLNVLVFVGMVATGTSPLNPDLADLIRWGANDGARTATGESWRLLASAFVHSGALHIALNMWVLWIAGPLVERLYGSVSFLAAYLFAALGGSLVSVSMHPENPSVGASGAVFGVFGALLAFVLRSHNTVPRSILRGLRSSALSFVGINILFGAVVPRIDNAAHIGGLVTGFLAGLCLARSIPPVPTRRNLRLALGAGFAVALFLVSGPLLGRVAADPKLAGYRLFSDGMGALRDERWDDAVALLSELLERDPTNAGVHYLRGYAYQRLEQLEAAVADARRAVSLDPGDAELGRFLSTTLNQRGFEQLQADDDAAAAADFTEAATYCGRDRRCKAGVLENLGFVHLRAGDPRAAFEHTERVNRIYDGLAWNWYFRGVSSRALGDEEIATSALGRWRGLRQPTDADLLRKLLPADYQVDLGSPDAGDP